MFYIINYSRKQLKKVLLKYSSSKHTYSRMNDIFDENVLMNFEELILWTIEAL